MKFARFLLPLFFFALAAQTSFADNGASDCLSCHDTKEFVSDFPKSVHAPLSCTECHTEATTVEHPGKLKPVNCASCHEAEHADFEKGIHAQAIRNGNTDAPSCIDCHGRHSILSHSDPKALTYSTQLSEKICGQCHTAERLTTRYNMPSDRLKTYMQSYHGMASRLGVTTVANCASCHGVHMILPSSDPKSTINKANLAKTCGQCHPGAGSQFTMGSVHVVSDSIGGRAVWMVTTFYIILICLVVGGMLFHNFLDFFHKMRVHYAHMREHGYERTFDKNERIQHWFLAFNFVALAYTGFALKFPGEWWAAPFNLLQSTVDWRGRLHRFFALLFVMSAVYHVLYVTFSKKGRDQVRQLALGPKDLSQAIEVIKFNLGWSKKKPELAHYSYVEKIEYWALAWGSVVMVVTGGALVFENFFMKFWPKWLLDVATAIHFYEAVLATLAIVLWHFYFTIYDPEHFPMNWSMITGGKPKNKDNEKK